jgi:hypothetical protein
VLVGSPVAEAGRGPRRRWRRTALASLLAAAGLLLPDVLAVPADPDVATVALTVRAPEPAPVACVDHRAPSRGAGSGARTGDDRRWW